jgi:two-component system cell cycle response regulator
MSERRDDWDTGVTDIVPPTPGERGRAYLIVLAGDNLGEMYDVGGEALIGRAREAAVALRDDGISRVHARVWREGPELAIEDLNSRNGTFVNSVRIHHATALHDGDKIHIGHRTILRMAVYDSLDDRFQRQLLDAAMYDALTRAHSRRHLLGQLDMELQFSLRHGIPLALILFDVDHFKDVNDRYGHEAGDRVLVALATLVQSHLRAEDLFGRLGGDEFGILCRATTSATAATLADRIRDLVEALSIDIGAAVLRITVSAGVAAVPELPCKLVQDLLHASDRALYMAKAHGRNQVAAPSSDQVEETRVVTRPQPPSESKT